MEIKVTNISHNDSSIYDKNITGNTLEIQETNSSSDSGTQVFFNIKESNLNGFTYEKKGNFTIFYYRKGKPLLMIGPQCNIQLFIIRELLCNYNSKYYYSNDNIVIFSVELYAYFSKVWLNLCLFTDTAK